MDMQSTPRSEMLSGTKTAAETASTTPYGNSAEHAPTWKTLGSQEQKKTMSQSCAGRQAESAPATKNDWVHKKIQGNTRDLQMPVVTTKKEGEN